MNAICMPRQNGKKRTKLECVDTTRTLESGLVFLNVGGVRYTTYRETLEAYPGTKLGRLMSDDDYHRLYFNEQLGEYFFDRCGFVFSAILDLYRTDSIHFPHDYCVSKMRQELIFWDIKEDFVSPCCRQILSAYDEDILQQVEMEKRCRYYTDDDCFDERAVDPSDQLCRACAVKTLGFRNPRKYIWFLVNEPSSFRMAKVYMIVYMIFTVLAVSFILIESHLSWRTPVPELQSCHNDTDSLSRKERFLMTSRIPGNFQYGSLVILLFFTLDIILRIICCSKKTCSEMWGSYLVDAIAYFSHFLTVVFDFAYPLQNKCIPGGEIMIRSFVTIRIISCIRIVRLFRLAKVYKRLRVIMVTLYTNWREFVLLLVVLTIFTIIFGFLIFIAELPTEDKYGSAGDGLWWAMITMTTVGYGDIYPETQLGRAVGIACAVVGIVISSLPIAIIGNYFQTYCKLACEMEKREKAKSKNHCKQCMLDSSAEREESLQAVYD